MGKGLYGGSNNNNQRGIGEEYQQNNGNKSTGPNRQVKVGKINKGGVPVVWCKCKQLGT